MSNFEKALAFVMKHEGGYVDHPDDPGGKTKYGITEATARLYGYKGDMRDLSPDQATEIYRKGYWLPVFDQFAYEPALCLFDAAVNSGVPRSVRWLQEAVGVQVDGALGPKTLAAALRRDPKHLALALSIVRLRFLTGLPTFDSFGRGWTRRIIRNIEHTNSLGG